MRTALEAEVVRLYHGLMRGLLPPGLAGAEFWVQARAHRALRRRRRWAGAPMGPPAPRCTSPAGAWRSTLTRTSSCSGSGARWRTRSCPPSSTWPGTPAPRGWVRDARGAGPGRRPSRPGRRGHALWPGLQGRPSWWRSTWTAASERRSRRCRPAGLRRWVCAGRVAPASRPRLQRARSADGARAARSALVWPCRGLLAVFEGRLGHGVLAAPPRGRRATLLVNWWDRQPRVRAPPRRSAPRGRACSAPRCAARRRVMPTGAPPLRGRAWSPSPRTWWSAVR